MCSSNLRHLTYVFQSFSIIDNPIVDTENLQARHISFIFSWSTDQHSSMMTVCGQMRVLQGSRLTGSVACHILVSDVRHMSEILLPGVSLPVLMGHGRMPRARG